ncbi:MAG TPA: TonB-dependent receptor [Novosphingobium sp.]|nr:TonB-dependent receptor [Novosphingobium sp.]
MASIALAAPAYAQDAEGSDPQAAEAAPERYLNEIVVTSQKRAENLQDVPVAVTALDGAAIKASGLEASSELSKLTPGLSVNRNANFVGLFLRGVGTIYANPGLEASVAVYQDDTYMPRTATSTFAFNDIERIEVLKGPQGTLYGRNAAAGAVRIITNDPKMGKWEGKASVASGSFNRMSIDGVVNAPLGDKVAIRLAAMYDSNDGYVKSPSPFIDDMQGRNQYHFAGKLKFEPTDTLTLKLSADYGIKEDREGQAFIALDQTCPTQIAVCLGGNAGPSPDEDFYTATQDYPPKGAKGDRFRTKNWGLAFRGDLDTGLGTLSSITAYRYYSFTGGADLDGTDIPFQHALTNGEYTKSFSEEVQLVSDGSGPLNYTLGFFYYKEKSGSDFNVSGAAINSQLGLPFPAVNGTVLDQPHLSARTSFDIESWAPYGQLDYKITDTISIIAGLRYTKESKRQNFQDLLAVIPALGVESSVYGGAYGPRTGKFSKLTPKLTVQFEPSNDVMVYGGWSRGFKSGGINSPDFARSPIVEPEVLDSYEVGLKSQFGNLRLNAAAFYYDYKNLQVQITSTQCGGSCVQNAANARVKGIEGDLDWAPSRSLSFGLGGSYLDTEFTDFPGGQSFVPSYLTAACAAAGGVPAAACLGYSVTPADHSGNRLPQAPKFSGYVRGSYTYFMANGSTVRLYGLASYSGDYYYGPDSSFGREPSKTLVTASLTFTSADEKFVGSVFVDNLLDEEYNTQYARQETGGWRVPGPPRTWGVRLTRNF